MKNNLTLIIVLVVVFFVGYFIRTNVLDEKLTEVNFEKDLIDFGTVELGTPLQEYVTFTNVGNSSLNIKNVEADCGCTVVEWPKHKIKINKTDSILVSYDSYIEGYFLRKVTVSSNTSEGNVFIWLTGTVK